MGSDSLTGLIRTVPICKKKYSQKDQLEEDPVTDAARLCKDYASHLVSACLRIYPKILACGF